jgi:hypothetical protein
MREPHIHADFIKAWADGDTIQYRVGPADKWEDEPKDRPDWSGFGEYRIKPTAITVQLKIVAQRDLSGVIVLRAGIVTAADSLPVIFKSLDVTVCSETLEILKIATKKGAWDA